MTILMYLLLDGKTKLADSPVYGEKVRAIAKQYGVDPYDIQCCEGGPDEDARYAYFKDVEGGHHYIPICKFDLAYLTSPTVTITVGIPGYVNEDKKC